MQRVDANEAGGPSFGHLVRRGPALRIGADPSAGLGPRRLPGPDSHWMADLSLSIDDA